MKKITSILLMSLISSSAMAFPKKLPKAYEVNCTVVDHRDVNRKILDRSFILHRGHSSRPAFTEHLNIKSADNDVRFVLGHNDEDDLIWIGFRDETQEYGSATYELNPRLMNVSFVSTSFTVKASCSFKPKKINKQKLLDEEKPEVNRP